MQRSTSRRVRVVVIPADGPLRRRAPRGRRLRSLLRMGWKEATLVRIDPETGRRTESVVPASSYWVGDLFAVRPRREAGDRRHHRGPPRTPPDRRVRAGGRDPRRHGDGRDRQRGDPCCRCGATRVGSDTTFPAQIGHGRPGPGRQGAKSSTSLFVPIVILSALPRSSAWLLAGGSVQATGGRRRPRGVSPCAHLGLATRPRPRRVRGRASQLGISLKNAEILEQTRSIDAYAPGRTGTVTTGRHVAWSVTFLRGRLLVDSLGPVLAAPPSGPSPSTPSPARSRQCILPEVFLVPVTAFANQRTRRRRPHRPRRACWSVARRWSPSRSGRPLFSRLGAVHEAEGLRCLRSSRLSPGLEFRSPTSTSVAVATASLRPSHFRPRRGCPSPPLHERGRHDLRVLRAPRRTRARQARRRQGPKSTSPAVRASR